MSEVCSTGCVFCLDIVVPRSRPVFSVTVFSYNSVNPISQTNSSSIMVYRDLPKADKALIWIAACQMLIGATCLGFGIWFLSDNYTGDEIKKMFWFWWGIVTVHRDTQWGYLLMLINCSMH